MPKFLLSAQISLLLASSHSTYSTHTDSILPSSAALPAGMAASAPVEVGAQGTIGSLVCREIEHFRRMEVVSHGHGKKSHRATASGGSPRSKARPAWKKGGGGGAFLPSLCSSAEVAEAAGSGRCQPAARVRYRHLGGKGDSLPQD